MKAEVDSGERPSTHFNPKKPKSTPKKDKTIGGRIAKSSGGTTNNEMTPSKKRKGNVVKEEGGGSRYVFISHPVPFRRTFLHNILDTLLSFQFLFSKRIHANSVPSSTSFLVDDAESIAAAGDERSNAADVESDGLSLYYDDGFGAEGMDIEAF